MKKLLISLPLVISLAALLYLPAGADDTVTASVTPLFLSAEIVGNSTIAYGPLPLSLMDDTRTQAESETITVKNASSVQADLMIRGSDATNAADAPWILDCLDSGTDRGTVGDKRFAHRFGLDPFDDAFGKALCSNVDKMLALDVPVQTSVDFDLQMNMPTSSDGYGQRTTTVTIIAVE